MTLAFMGALATGVAAFWSSLRAWLDTVLSLVWVRARFDWPASGILLPYLDRHYRRGFLGTPTFTAFQEYVRPNRRREWVGTRPPGLREFFWQGLAFIVVSALQNGDGSGANYNVDVAHIRGMFNTEALYIRALEEFNARNGSLAKQGTRYRVWSHFGYGRMRGDQNVLAAPSGGLARETTPSAQDDEGFRRSRPLRWKPEDLGAPTEAQPFAGLVYPPEIEAIANRVRRWRESESFYRARRIPWRMGILGHGLPGTGKTSFARAIAQELDLPIHTYDLGSMENRELRQAWQSCAQDAPAVALIEDVDRVFRGRDNIVPESTLTLDMLLNCISGVEPSEGILTMITANDISLLDPALTRPGRLDVIAEFGPMDQLLKSQLCGYILGDWQASQEVLADTTLVTPAQVQARCAEIALSRLYQ